MDSDKLTSFLRSAQDFPLAASQKKS